MILALLAAAAAVQGASAAPADPTPPPLQPLKQVVVDAIRNCPGKAEGELVVCAPDRGYSLRYRLPKATDRQTAAVEAARPPALIVEDGPIDRCGPIGAAGATGCSLAQARAWAEEKARRKAAGEYFPW